jgi:hypothetical protein
MGSALVRVVFRLMWVMVVAAAAAVPALGHAQGFRADYDIARFSSAGDTAPSVRIAPAFSLGGDASGAGLSMQAGRNWFGQVELAQVHAAALLPPATNDIVNIAGGYRWGNGRALSLELSRGRSSGQRLGLAVNYDWPHYFVRLSFDQGLNLAPQDSLRFSAGVRF